jgi:hypothetical protein
VITCQLVGTSLRGPDFTESSSTYPLEYLVLNEYTFFMELPTRIIFVLSGVTLFTVTFFSLLHPAARDSICTPHVLSHSTPPQQRDRKLHLLFPINAGAAKAQAGPFCKTLLSAIVHGYDPIIINWDVDRDWMFMQRMKVIGV